MKNMYYIMHLQFNDKYDILPPLVDLMQIDDVGMI